MKAVYEGWCNRYGVKDTDLYFLLHLANMRAKHCELEISDNKRKHSYNEYAYRVAFETKAREVGFEGVEWNGLYPTLRKGGYETYLPD